MASKTKLDKNLLKGLEPLGNLAYDKLEELVSKATIEDLPAGRTLFREGEKDNRTLYLIQGQVEFRQSGEKKSRVIKSKNAQARQPLDNHQPHTGTAKAKGPVTVVSIDSALLEIILNDTPLDAYEFEVTELGGEDTTDWMLRFLQSRAFLKLPTDNIQAILMRMQERPAKKGDRIIHQGEQDDYYYIVQSGRCNVTRRPAPKAGEIPLATLEEGDGFGEEALITNGRRNASISMLEDGILMRLKKEDFLAYLAEPLITRLSESDTAAKLDNGALLIDVRSHEEFNRQHAEGSVNIPLSMLRLKLDGLNPDREYVLASADGTQSAAAAFLLTQHGFECGILDGGLQATSFKLTGGSDDQGEAAAAAAPASKRTAAAEKTRQAAEDQARKISQQADTARREAEQLAEKTASAEKAKRDAEQEIRRLSEQNQQAEKTARKQAEQARHQAEAELQKIQTAKRANEEKQQALDASLKRAQQIAAEATEAAKRSREKAEKEAAAIRRQAREEAEQLKQEMEETRRRFEQRTSQAEQEKEAQRQAAIEQARQEAKAIRQQAQSEAERLRSELETARQAVDQRAAEVEQQERQKQVSLLEKARSRAMELAEKTTRIAEQEAEEIRRKALEEAEQLRQEMEQTRQQVMEHAARAQQEAQARAKQEVEEQARREAEARARKEADEQARREAEARAKQEADEQARREAEARAKQEADEQARREADEARAKEEADEQARREAEARAKQEADEQARREAEARAKQEADEQARREAEARAKQEADEQARREAEARSRQQAEQESKQNQEREARRQQAIHQAQHRRQEQARRMAEEIKAKLEQAEQQRQAEEERQRGEGLSLARATLQRKPDGRIILEGEEDIFIFKEPSVTPEQIKAELDNEPQRGTGGSSAELPSFEIEETEKPVFKPLNTQAVHARLAEQQASHQQKRKKRHVFALAASLMLALGSGGVYLFLHPELIDQHVIARSDTGKSTTIRAGVGTLNNKESKEKDNKDEQSRQTHENNLESNLRERFDNLLEQWKEIVSR
ncbi:cyclic nucleotide-binding domain-containing protein [Thiohalophilus sp.]|uniref:cyclic nucleotide-binding domain-containing protein n=1 Tax=Thiohalophilus sp. TaxID=3028392 RepID=UPI002ACE1AFC|nr:cyclic nucleotide-binding domain-containing protein [Thiohalophilus sp.]MDZ7804106.1 cyclic nucleotide-binding domain-containing protein [Thiohalophilus sp.]